MRRTTGPWLPDVLAGFEQTPLGAATLVRAVAQPRRPLAAVLHVHGYNDYFFQTHLARAFIDAEYAFYAVDLPFAGRSLKEGDIPHFMMDAADQGDHIAEACEAISTLHPGVPLVVHGHSTGGLTAIIWAADRPHPALAAVILDSPLFGVVGTAARKVIASAVPMVAQLWPLTVVAQAPSVWSQLIHVSNGGRWDFDQAWKRPSGVPIRAGWLTAVRRAQRRVADGLGLTIPVLAARSDSCGPDEASNPRIHDQDVVVDVDLVAEWAPRLGTRVDELVIEGGIHELSLSKEEPRHAYLEGVIGWLGKVVT